MARNYDYNGDPCGEYGSAVRDVEQLREELSRLRLTDAEREVLVAIEADAAYRAMERTQRVVRGLLERLG